MSDIEEQLAKLKALLADAKKACGDSLPPEKSSASPSSEKPAALKQKEAKKANVDEKIDRDSAKKDVRKKEEKQKQGGQKAQGKPVKDGTSDGKEPGAEKSKADLRKERRAIQEAQRAAKELSKPAEKPSTKAKTENKSSPAAASASVSNSETKTTTTGVLSRGKPKVKEASPADVKTKPTSLAAPLALPHLPSPCPEDEIFAHLPVFGGQFHPAVVKFGLQMHRGLLRGSTTRVFGLLHTLSQVLRDYEAPAGKELIRDFDATVLKPSLEFLHRCRPLSLSMRNTVEVFRQTLFGMENTQGDNEVKLKMLEHIADSTEFIRLAREQIKLTAAARIVDEDVVLIYGYCALVTSIVKYAKEHLKKEFKVIVVDTGPDFEGKLSLEELCCAGIQACYTYITALNVVMSKVNKVILGADAILANGAVKGPIGASQVAMVANSRNVPVLVCCETFKFTETVQTDSFHFNELGPESELLNLTENLNLNPGSTSAQIKTLNLKYDVMPGDFVSALVTEIGMLPCSSVPVVTREHFLRRA